jgi:hypothetical protein
MRIRPFRTLSAPAVLTALALAPTADAAPPAPFGHACAPLDGALVCPTSSDAARVPSFDGGSKADPQAGGAAPVTNAALSVPWPA